MPEAEVAIDLGLVRQLIGSQAPWWAQEEITYLATGWDNEVYRLGADLLIRLPRRQLGETIGHRERQWLPDLVQACGLDIGLPVFVGRPAAGYPFTFSVSPYVPGRSAARIDRNARDAYAPEFARFLRKLHQPAGVLAPSSQFRGGPLPQVDARTREQISQLDAEVQDAAQALWQDALDTDEYAGPAVWLHGDPHPHNTIVTEGAGPQQLVSLVDFGDVCAGDPASDLGMLWMHFSAPLVTEAFSIYGVRTGTPLWRRARGWALRYAMLTAALGPADLLGAVGRESLDLLLGAGAAPGRNCS